MKPKIISNPLCDSNRHDSCKFFLIISAEIFCSPPFTLATISRHLAPQLKINPCNFQLLLMNEFGEQKQPRLRQSNCVYRTFIWRIFIGWVYSHTRTTSQLNWMNLNLMAELDVWSNEYDWIAQSQLYDWLYTILVLHCRRPVENSHTAALGNLAVSRCQTEWFIGQSVRL